MLDLKSEAMLDTDSSTLGRKRSLEPKLRRYTAREKFYLSYLPRSQRERDQASNIPRAR